jgi:hypothetical protein
MRTILIALVLSSGVMWNLACVRTQGSAPPPAEPKLTGE